MLFGVVATYPAACPKLWSASAEGRTRPRIRRRKMAGISAIKLYFVQTARANPKPRRPAFFTVELSSDKNLSKRKSSSTNNGIVVAWIIRTGRNAKKKANPK
jgi:hypothetical protein